MAPTIVLVVSSGLLWLAGFAGIEVFQDPGVVLRGALGLMFFLTASGHWGKMRPDLIRMVPSRFPRPDLLVTVTGVLEILGAVGLLIPATAWAASVCLALLVIALYPANVWAARLRLTIGGRPVPNLPVRTAMQFTFLAALLGAALL